MQEMDAEMGQRIYKLVYLAIVITIVIGALILNARNSQRPNISQAIPLLLAIDQVDRSPRSFDFSLPGGMESLTSNPPLNTDKLNMDQTAVSPLDDQSFQKGLRTILLNTEVPNDTIRISIEASVLGDGLRSLTVEFEREDNIASVLGLCGGKRDRYTAIYNPYIVKKWQYALKR